MNTSMGSTSEPNGDDITERLEALLAKLPEPPYPMPQIAHHLDQLDAAYEDYLEACRRGEVNLERGRELTARQKNLMHRMRLNQRWFEIQDRAERGF